MGLLTPLQLTATAYMLDNQGIDPLPPALTTALTTFNSTTVIANYLAALDYYRVQSWATPATLLSLQSIGATNCPALGDSIPAAPLGDFTNLTPVVDPGGFSGLIEQTGNLYLGNGNSAQFASNFMGVQGFVSSINSFIVSSVNAQTYLGPTFNNMDSLITNSISSINPNFDGFGTDIANQGRLVNTRNLNNYGTPAALLQQLAAVADLQGGMISVVADALTTAGLSKTDIGYLLATRSTLTEPQLNQLQRLAYSGMLKVTGADLQQVLDILDITTPGINSMADLLNPQKVFPNSWETLQTPTPAGYVPVYDPAGSVDMNLQSSVSVYLPTPTSCDDLGKIIPPEQAVANKAVQIGLQQITGMPNATWPAVAQVIKGFTRSPWDINRTYLENAVVAEGAPIPTFYRAQQTVPAGTDITDTNYWLPTTLGGLNTLEGLPDLQSQTTPLSPTVTSYYTTDVATGTGPDGTITICDVIGTAIDYNNLTAQLNSATTAINALNGLGALNNLKSRYVQILSESTNAGVITQIALANSDIATIVANPSYSSYVSALNTAFVTMAASLSSEKNYQIQGGLDFSVPYTERSSVFAFVQNLPQYGTQVDACGPAYYLTETANISNVGGQAIVAVMRDGQNNQRLNAGRLGLNITAPDNLAVTPVPVVTPVY